MRLAAFYHYTVIDNNKVIKFIGINSSLFSN